MECDLQFVIGKPSISIWLQLAYLATAGPELGTAQSQLVSYTLADPHSTAQVCVQVVIL